MVQNSSAVDLHEMGLVRLIVIGRKIITAWCSTIVIV
jgi:hypothetical protein